MVVALLSEEPVKNILDGWLAFAICFPRSFQKIYPVPGDFSSLTFISIFVQVFPPKYDADEEASPTNAPLDEETSGPLKRSTSKVQ